MSDYLVSEKTLAGFFTALATGRRLLAPQGQGDDCRLAETTGPVSLDYANTHLSPKGVFFPQTEKILAFHKLADKPKANQYQDLGDQAQPTVIFGLRPCDARGLTVSNRVFQNDRFTDPYWKGKYESAIKIGLACLNPSPQCFCAAMGGSPFGEMGLDVLAYPKDQGLGLKALTPAGEEILKKAQAEPADLAADMAALEKKAIQSQGSLDDYATINERKIMELYKADHWAKTAEPCLGCGVCTFFCPTCHCFDIQDEQNEVGGVRMRNWDTCMSPLFTLHGSGHNPRPSKVERVRQRFMHKLKYIPLKQDGVRGCTGCGRCVVMCPANIDIRSVAAVMAQASA
ncbi:MAG: 4Fe-4S dicluster domain-containing protein [Deltaproteobacteria bacterium]|jgi:ferredoxin|nr:4Fe-4S dicluster domain-containing protein [Deltaproteobacteria bacterium]